MEAERLAAHLSSLVRARFSAVREYRNLPVRVYSWCVQDSRQEDTTRRNPGSTPSDSLPHQFPFILP
jgi:uncharacterized protein with von Willebrand factor type A (vWA) domain